jgi:hypothetical protein
MKPRSNELLLVPDDNVVYWLSVRVGARAGDGFRLSIPGYHGSGGLDDLPALHIADVDSVSINSRKGACVDVWLPRRPKRLASVFAVTGWGIPS